MTPKVGVEELKRKVSGFLLRAWGIETGSDVELQQSVDMLVKKMQ